MTAADLTEPAIVRITGVRSGYEGYQVVVDRFLPVYRRMRELTDVDPSMTPFRASLTVFKELVSDGWKQQEARYYMWAARTAYEEHLDPTTGRPLTGTAAIHPVHVQHARNLIRSALPATMDADLAGGIADQVVNLLADSGWRPKV